MGIDIRPYGLNKNWKSKIYYYWVIPTHCRDWSTLYGILPNYRKYPLNKGLNFLRIRGRHFNVNLFKYDQVFFNTYDKNKQILRYLTGSNKFPFGANRDHSTNHKFRDVALDMKLRPRLSRNINLISIKRELETKGGDYVYHVRNEKNNW